MKKYWQAAICSPAEDVYGKLVAVSISRVLIYVKEGKVDSVAAAQEAKIVTQDEFAVTAPAQQPFFIAQIAIIQKAMTTLVESLDESRISLCTMKGYRY